MVLMSFDEILTGLCDKFDELIAPRKIARSNTNIIYLIFKSIAKGFEVINNVCVVLNNKFNPAKCSEEDLVSVASLVGTNRRSGSASGLKITVTNSEDSTLTLPVGTYTYKLDEQTSFEFEVLSATDIISGGYVSFIAMSNSIGRYPVTAQSSIEVTANVVVPTGFTYSCDDNSSLLGVSEESILSFRNRIMNTYDRQNGIIELEEYLRNLPYIFDCKVRYNQTTSDIVEGDVTIPPMTCAIFYAGEAKNEIAEMVADHIICPTVATQDSVEVRYINEVFAGGYYAVNIIPFKHFSYTLDLIYTVDEEYVNVDEAMEKMTLSLKKVLNVEQYVPYIKEDDIYNAIESLGYIGLEILAVNLRANGSAVDYVSVPVSRIAELTAVNYVEG